MRRAAWQEMAEAIGVVLVLVLLAYVVAACGSASPAVKGAYSLEAARCIANEREIVERSGTTEEQDRADLAAERARCDAELAQIELSEAP